MDLKDLRGRLEIIKNKSEPLRPPEQPGKGNRPEPGASLLEHGWKKLSDMVYEKESVVKNVLPDVVSEVLLPEKLPQVSSKLVFYDTETTGLSAGAGNIVFLAGFGEILPGGDEFRTIQIFLSDFPGEPAFLKRLSDFISPDRIYVSYNGKSFDTNVLHSRFSMNALRAEFGYQIDLLYSSRRLWKNIIGACSLGDIERRVLDKHRELDVPGYMVPDLYFDFIREGRWETIEGVIAHHREDIASLAELLAVHEQLFADAEGAPPNGFYDPLGLAALLTEKRPGSAEAVLRESWEGGNHRAGIELSLMLKRENRRIDAVPIWKKLWDDGRSIFAGTELAKYYEHHAHDIPAALAITDAMLGLERFRIINYREELEIRKKRLRGKHTLSPET